MVRNPVELKRHISTHGVRVQDYFESHVQNEEKSSTEESEEVVVILASPGRESKADSSLAWSDLDNLN